MGIYEPCQVGNKAALRRTSYVPRGCRVEGYSYRYVRPLYFDFPEVVMDDFKKYLSDCTLCPRNCHVNRLAGEQGYCGMPGDIVANQNYHEHKECVIAKEC